MNPATLTKRIHSLPDELQRQVVDFVEFLLIKHQIHSDKETGLTLEQIDELLELWKDYEKNPNDVLTIEMLQDQTKVKYGL